MGKRTIEIEDLDFALVIKMTKQVDGLGNVTGYAPTTFVYVGDKQIGLVTSVSVKSTSSTTPEIDIQLAEGMVYEDAKRMPVELKKALDDYATHVAQIPGVRVGHPMAGPRGRGGDFIPTMFPIPSGIIRPDRHEHPTGAGHPTGPHGRPTGPQEQPTGAEQPTGPEEQPTGPHGHPTGAGQPSGPHGHPTGAGQPEAPPTGPTGPEQPTGVASLPAEPTSPASPSPAGVTGTTGPTPTGVTGTTGPGQPTGVGGGQPTGPGGGQPTGHGHPGGARH